MQALLSKLSQSTTTNRCRKKINSTRIQLWILLLFTYHYQRYRFLTLQNIMNIFLWLASELSRRNQPLARVCILSVRASMKCVLSNARNCLMPIEQGECIIE